jgi:CubicO group peptidase (beta-lactamase class C family)/ubiquinone/menaquinone biosynthesis C-methylase UbiE
MRKIRNNTGILGLLLVALTASLSGREAAQSAREAGQLAEPREKRANDIQPPELVMDILGVRPGLVVGEVGAGRGRVTVHLAARVGNAGKVYANDIDPSALEALEARCRRLGLANVEVIRSLPGDARFPQNRLDLALMTWVYHHVDDPVPLLKSLLPSLKPWGFVALVEPKPSQTEDEGKALTRESVGKEAQAAGFALDAVIEDRFEEDNVFILRPLVPDAAESRDRQKVRALWLDYLAWAKTVQGRPSIRDYAASLDAIGVPGPEIRRRLHVLRGQFTEQPEGIEMIYDPLYGKPLTGDLEKDGFKIQPNAFLVEAMKDIPPGGRALDVGAGMGRNAVHLAGLGWDVTGIDLSAEGLAVLRANAEKAGLRVQTVKTSYEEFDFGRERWDLVAMILSWAPVEEPAFLDRLKASIRPGGYVVYEHVVQRAANPFPPGVHALAAGALRELFRDFEILTYREEDHAGDWGGPPTPHVWMVARKRGYAVDSRVPPAPPGTFRTLAGEVRSARDAERFLLDLMEASRIAALSAAIVQDDRVAFEGRWGVVDPKTRKPADERTVFRAASLSKPVFSYLVMKLVDEGLLALDQPLADFIDPPFTSYPEYASLRGEPGLAALTPAILLSHASGFPNWRRQRWTGPLPLLFVPGTEFSYSGEGYHLLQFLIEKKTGRGLNELAKKKVFDPLGMGRTSFLWEDRFDGDFAVALDAGLGPLIRRSKTFAVSAGSLLTNASDYARFLLAALSGRDLKSETAAAWRAPRIRVAGKALHDRAKPESSLNDDIQLSWTPGWGWFRSPAGEALFHVGAEEGCENYVVIFPEKKTAVVVFSVTGQAARVTPPVVEKLIGDVYSPFTWMNY